MDFSTVLLQLIQSFIRKKIKKICQASNKKNSGNHIYWTQVDALVTKKKNGLQFKQVYFRAHFMHKTIWSAFHKNIKKFIKYFNEKPT